MKCIAADSVIDIQGVSLRCDGEIIVSDGDFIDFEKSVSPYCEEYFATLGNRIACGACNKVACACV